LYESKVETRENVIYSYDIHLDRLLTRLRTMYKHGEFQKDYS
jgi:hypothetical protein